MRQNGIVRYVFLSFRGATLQKNRDLPYVCHTIAAYDGMDLIVARGVPAHADTADDTEAMTRRPRDLVTYQGGVEDIMLRRAKPAVQHDPIAVVLAVVIDQMQA